MNPTTNDILGLVKNVILPLHEIKRQNKLPVGRRRLENDVEHSWTVAVLACTLAPQLDAQLDVGKISQFGIIHDLVEIYAGDTKMFSATANLKLSKVERERAALYRLESEYQAFPWLASTISDYESMASDEACFVYAVDKYIAVIYDLLDQGQYLHQIGTDKPTYDRVMAQHHVKAQRHSAVGKYYNEIRRLIDQQPEFLKAPGP